MDEFTFLIKNFVYDGNGPDTFFWTGSSTRAGPQGFIIPNEKGRTNVLQPYLNKDFTLKMPDGKRITDVKWLSVYDLTLQVLEHSHFNYELYCKTLNYRRTLEMYQLKKGLSHQLLRNSLNYLVGPTGYPHCQL